jgi:DNA-binding response OmpR family regulator
MSNSSTFKIAIVEDDLDLQQSMAESLIACGYQVWAEGSAEAFYRRILREPVNLVILDVGLPGEDGLSVAQHLQGIPNLAAIIISGRVAVEDRLAGLRAGADRYLIKPINLDELIANIEVIERRFPTHPAQLEPQTSLATFWTLDTKDWVLYSPEGKSLKLTSGEFALLSMLIQAQGNVVKKIDIADKLFESRAINGDERIAVFLSRLRNKADVTFGQAIPIKTVQRTGYVFSEQSILK